MKIYFKTRDSSRAFANTVRTKGASAKLHDAKEKGGYSVNGSRFGVELIKKVG